MGKKNRPIDAANKHPIELPNSPAEMAKTGHVERCILPRASATTCDEASQYAASPVAYSSAPKAPPLPTPPAPPRSLQSPIGVSSYPPSSFTKAAESPSKFAPSCVAKSSESYPPVRDPEGLAAFNRWRAQTNPRLHLWETQTLPRIHGTVEWARETAHELYKHGVQKGRELLDPQTRELTAQLRTLRATASPAHNQGWLLHLHRVGLGMQPVMPAFWSGAQEDAPVHYFDPNERRVKSELKGEDWTWLPD